MKNHVGLKKNETVENDIAIIGMSMRFPMAKHSQQFWKILSEGIDCVRTIPEVRFQFLNGYRATMKKGTLKLDQYGEAAFLDDIDVFDHEFFGISKRDASLMDPNQRILLQIAYEAFEDALYPIDSVQNKKIGVYIGYVGEDQYKKIIEDIEPNSLSAAMSGNISSIISARISYVFDLKGPNMVINTACSSSLVATHLACKALLNNECEMAMAGGIQIYPLPIKNTKVGIESSSYRSKTFDDSSDGTGCGEGAGVIVLKRLKDALKDNDLIYAVIKGSAINQDGRSMGIASPNHDAQAEVINEAWIDAGIDPLDVSYIESHGTGTKLGDPIEIAGITKAFDRYTDDRQFCAVGAVKTNIGHLDSAAGIAGIIKCVLQLTNQKMVPTVHFKKPNSSIDFQETPVYISDRLTDWETRGNRRICGISSFGIGGTNCHMVLAEAPYTKSKIYTNHFDYTIIFTLSAKNADALHRLAESYISFLRKSKEPIENISYSANTGRTHYKYRIAIIGNEVDEVASCLERYVKCEYKSSSNTMFFTDDSVKDVCDIPAAEVIVDEFITSKYQRIDLLEKIARFYVSGQDWDFSKLYPNKSLHKVSIPYYSFAESRSWIKIPDCIDTDFIDQNQEIAINAINDFKNDQSLLTRRVYSRTELIQKVKEIFSKVMECEIENSDADFIELGGDSILALDIVYCVYNEFNLEIPLSVFMSNPTVIGLAENIERYLETEKIDTDSKSIPKAGKKEYYPVSSAQKRMYLAGKMDESALHYNISSAYKIMGKLDVEKVKKAFEILLSRHEALRTSCKVINGEIVQQIHETAEVRFNYLLGDEIQIKELIHNSVKPFDFNDPSLIRINLIKFSESCYILVCDMHHVISDGTSSNTIVKEFSELYQGKTLEPSEYQYKDFSEWQNNCFFESESMRKQEEYWMDLYANDISFKGIPTDYPRPAYKDFLGETMYHEIDAVLFRGLKAMATEHSVTLFMVLFSAYNVLLHIYSGSNEIVAGTVVSARTNKTWQDIVGMFVNTLALKNTIDRNDTYIDVMKRVNDSTLTAYNNQDYPFELLLEKLNLKYDASRNPLFDTMFMLQNSTKKPIEISDLEIECLEPDQQFSKFDITLNCYESSDVMKVEINYATSLYKAETIECFWNDYRTIIEKTVQNPEIKIGDIHLDAEFILPETQNYEVNFDFE